MRPADTKFRAILIATGSEVELAMEAMRALQTGGIGVRVVSMPCTELFDAQSLEYREGVLPSWCRARVAIEAASSDYWRKYVGLDGEVIGMTRFGASAPADTLFAQFGFTVEYVLDAVKRVSR
jgi:transketolase